MKIFKDIYINKKDVTESNFYMLYSNNSFLRGNIACRKGTDGNKAADLILIEDSLTEGQYKFTTTGFETKTAGSTEWKLWKSDSEESFNSDNEIFSKFKDAPIIEDFLINNQDLLLDLKPVTHDYMRLECRTNLSKPYFVVNWFLGNTCSYSCSYCPSYLNDGSLPWMDIKILKKFIDQLFSFINDKEIVIEFTGGEVTLYKDFIELCSYIKAKGGRISMISNGSRTMEWWKKNVQYFDQITLSYHTEEANRAHYLELVELLRRNVDLSANIMVPPGKLDFCIALAQETKSMKDCGVCLMPIIEDLEGELLPEYTKEELDAIDAFNAKGAEFATHTKTDWLDFRGIMYKIFPNGEQTSIAPPLLVSNKENTWLGWNCHSGLSQIIINAEGDIYRGWCYVGGKIGNIANPNVVFPDKPILCNKELCHCNFDAFSIKEYPPSI